MPLTFHVKHVGGRWKVYQTTKRGGKPPVTRLRETLHPSKGRADAMAAAKQWARRLG